MRPPKTTVALRVARMLADGWHIEPCGRVSPQSHEQRKRGPFPGLAGLPSPRASDCSSVRLPPLCSINSVRGYPSGGQLCSVKRPALAPPGMRLPCGSPRNSLPLGPQGLFSPPISRPGSPARDMPRPACTIRHGPRSLFRRFSPQSAGEDHRSLQRHGHGLAGWHVKVPKQKIPGGAGTKPAKRRDRSPAAGESGRRAARGRAIQKRPPRAESGKGVSNDLWQRPTFPHDVMQYHRRWRA